MVVHNSSGLALRPEMNFGLAVMLTYQHLRRYWELAGERRGWDFSRLKVRRDPVPWAYEDVVRDHLSGSEKVLDIGTGGGERLIRLAGEYGSAVGIDIDPEMIGAAKENLPYELSDRIEFRVANSHCISLPDSSVDVALNRHSVVDVEQVVRVLSPRGRFIWQNVGEKNLEAVVGPFGGQYHDSDQHPETIRDSLIHHGMIVTRLDEYDVGYRFLDLESLIFQIKAMGHYLPADMRFESVWEIVAQVAESIRSPEGHYLSNEHRWLLTAEKP
jgi:hypothetical protein